MRLGDWILCVSMALNVLAALEITEIRVQRLQEISYADAIAEGVSYDKNPSRIHGHWSNDEGNPVYQFRALWESINGAGSWAENPWVWAITFQKVTV